MREYVYVCDVSTLCYKVLLFMFCVSAVFLICVFCVHVRLVCYALCYFAFFIQCCFGLMFSFIFLLHNLLFSILGAFRLLFIRFLVFLSPFALTLLTFHLFISFPSLFFLASFFHFPCNVFPCRAYDSLASCV